MNPSVCFRGNYSYSRTEKGAINEGARAARHSLILDSARATLCSPLSALCARPLPCRRRAPRVNRIYWGLTAIYLCLLCFFTQDKDMTYHVIGMTPL